MHSTSLISTTRGAEPLPRHRTVIAAWVLVFLAGIAAPAAAGPAVPTFTEIAQSAGIKFKHTFGAKTLENVLHTTGSGCALFDYDNDGWLDILFVNGTYLDDMGKVTEKTAHHALYHNRGDGTFENVTDAAGFGEATYGQGVACADYDGDGFTDVYITNYGPNRLYRNRGDGTFEDVTESSGTGDPRYGGGAIFFDYDGDQDLDLFVANYLKFRPDMVGVHSSELSKKTGFKSFPGPRDYPTESGVLYRNDGDGTFTDVTAAAGVGIEGRGLTVVAVDFDRDGDQDLFVANDRSPNYLYRNDGGRFTEVALEAGLAYDPDGVESAAMGLAVVDVDRDGLQDLFVTNMLFEFNNLYRNMGEFLFADITRNLGLDKDSFRHVGWGTIFNDFNHDGEVDCFIANGHVVDYVEGFSESITYRQRNMLFLGTGDGKFKEVAKDCGAEFREKRVCRGAVFGDIDNDGDVDIVILNSGDLAQVFRNDTPVNNRWIKIKLAGHPPNTHGIGAKVHVQAGESSYHYEVAFAASYLSSSDPTLHVGLAPGVDEVLVDIEWPSGMKSQARGLPGQLLIVDEPVEAGE